MTKPYIILSLVTSIDTSSWNFGCRFLSALLLFDGKLTPEFVSNVEPIKTPFVSVDETEEFWAPTVVVRGPHGRTEAKSSFLWRRLRSVKHDGHVMHTSINKMGKKALGSIIVRAQVNREIEWLSVFRDLCMVVQPKFGMLHLFTEQELVEAGFKSPEYLFQSGPPGWAVEGSIPNLAWASFLGDELAAEVGRERLVGHGFSVDSMANGHLITVTESLLDVAERFDEFSKRRAELKGLFRPGLFQIN